MDFSYIRNRFYLTRRALLAPSETPWRKLLQDGSSTDFFAVCGLDIPAFRHLAGKFEVLLRRPATHPGRKSALQPADRLGLALHYINSVMVHKTLSQIFGIVPSTTSRDIHLACQTLLHVLRHDPDGRISWPNAAELRKFSDMISKVEVACSNIFGFVDGMTVKIYNPTDPSEHKLNYNMWKVAGMHTRVSFYARTTRSSSALSLHPTGHFAGETLCRQQYYCNDSGRLHRFRMHKLSRLHS